MARQGGKERAPGWTTRAALSCGAASALFSGTVVALSFVAGGFSGPSYEAVTNWLWAWQTLIGALFALVAAYFTVRPINRQLAEAKRQSAAIAMEMYNRNLIRIVEEEDRVSEFRKSILTIFSATGWSFRIRNLDLPERYPDRLFAVWKDCSDQEFALRRTFVVRPSSQETAALRDKTRSAFRILEVKFSGLSADGSVSVHVEDINVDDEDVPIFEDSRDVTHIAEANRAVQRAATEVVKALRDYQRSLRREQEEAGAGISASQEIIAGPIEFDR